MVVIFKFQTPSSASLLVALPEQSKGKTSSKLSFIGGSYHLNPSDWPILVCS